MSLGSVAAWAVWQHRLLAGWFFAICLCLGLPAQAHGTHAGDLLLDHPYAVPSQMGEPHGRAYLRGIKNAGAQADRLVSASTPVAANVILHTLKADTNGLRGTQVVSIDLPAKTVTMLRHTGDYQLTLVDLKAPLKDGDRFDLTLNFQHAGSQTVKVWVQTPREAVTAHGH
jgi:copper(I)-binding protein